MIHLPYVDDILAVDQRFDFLPKVSLFLLIERLARYNNRQASFLRDFNGVQWRLLPAYAPQEGQILAGRRRELIGFKITTVIDHPNLASPVFWNFSNLLPADSRDCSVCITVQQPNAVGRYRIMECVQD